MQLGNRVSASSSALPAALAGLGLVFLIAGARADEGSAASAPAAAAPVGSPSVASDSTAVPGKPTLKVSPYLMAEKRWMEARQAEGKPAGPKLQHPRRRRVE